MDDGFVQVLIKTESIPSELDYHHSEEVIIPDLVSSEDVSSPDEDSHAERVIKIEHSETPNDADNDLENPYQCFECGLDCESQNELIDHYESVHVEECPPKPGGNYKGNPCAQADGTGDDPLAGDVAPDSPDFEKTSTVEGAQNDATPHEVLLLYSCPCCGHSSTDWNNLTKHMEKHVKVSCLTCSKCMYIFSSSYHLKDYTGGDSSDKLHVCCHCPFKTQLYQLLKDHCLAHHEHLSSVNSSKDHHLGQITAANQSCAPTNNLKSVENSIPQITSVPVGFKAINSQPQNSIPLAIPYNSSQTGCFMVLGNTVPSGPNLGNVPVPSNPFIPVFHGVGPNGVSAVPQVLNMNPMNFQPGPTVLRVHEKGAANTPSNVPNQNIHPTFAAKLENPPAAVVSPRLLAPKSAHRIFPPKVAVDELLEKWSVPNFAPKVPDISPKVVEASAKPDVHLNSTLLAGLPPYRAPRGSQLKSRRGVKNKPCPYCSHVARDAHSLKTHILIHTKEKPFACEFCEYRATQRAHIQKHMVTHVDGNRRGKKHRSVEGTIEQ